MISVCQIFDTTHIHTYTGLLHTPQCFKIFLVGAKFCPLMSRNLRTNPQRHIGGVAWHAIGTAIVTPLCADAPHPSNVLEFLTRERETDKYIEEHLLPLLLTESRRVSQPVSKQVATPHTTQVATPHTSQVEAIVHTPHMDQRLITKLRTAFEELQRENTNLRELIGLRTYTDLTCTESGILQLPETVRVQQTLPHNAHTLVDTYKNKVIDKVALSQLLSLPYYHNLWVEQMVIEALMAKDDFPFDTIEIGVLAASKNSIDLTQAHKRTRMNLQESDRNKIHLVRYGQQQYNLATLKPDGHITCTPSIPGSDSLYQILGEALLSKGVSLPLDDTYTPANRMRAYASKAVINMTHTDTRFTNNQKDVPNLESLARVWEQEGLKAGKVSEKECRLHHLGILTNICKAVGAAG
eukprot:Blabericola_migrator_1__7445@NODE_3797_length_1503_cov_129_151811_g2355_i0_p1_GENE_NODE_3797_length_1503_cov_129_151811_g2355_i0NODE_3797_length_1503_cov_129_151811_g2355_i0_p1_ORF_typecomplete_len410_score83_44_NODE_3797_length_1503_cov_129_151811_g2355_i01831412